MMQLGLRQARYRGSAKTLFQAFMVAAVANLTLLAGTGLPLVAAITCLMVPIWAGGSLLARYSARSGSLTQTYSQRGPATLWHSGDFKMAPSRPDF
jgi:hypothetical protein